MKNKEIKNIDDFKKRVKLLYEYRVHDLNMNKEESVYHFNEDETQEPAAQPAPEPSAVPAPEPIQDPVAQPEQAAEPIQEPVPAEPAAQEDNQMISYLKSEMQKLENVVSSLDTISRSVDSVSQRLDKLNSSMFDLTKIVDEIKEPSDIEKLEMRAFDSYPYNQTLTKVWDDKLKSKEEQNMDRMGVYKSDDGYEMEYTPQRNFNHNQSTNNF